MKLIAILNRYSENTLDYKKALNNIEADFLFITRTKHKDIFKDYFSNRKTFDTFHENKNIENFLSEINLKNKIDSIVVSHEFDIEKAAHIREKLKIKGQSLNSAVCFRDKNVMKEKLKDIVNIPKFSQINNFSELENFKKEHGYPFIVKPIDGAGSVGFFQFHNNNDWEEYRLHKHNYPLIAEEFIFGEMYHLDGIFSNGEIKAFSSGIYVNGCLAFFENKYNGSVLISENSLMYARLKTEITKVLQALETPNHAISFHGEFFHTADDKLIFCEVGSRVGGGKINEVFELKYGINLLNESIRAQCDPEYDNTKLNITTSKYEYGWMLVPPKKAILVSINENIPFDWIVKISFRKSKIGEFLDGGNSSVSEYVSVIIKGKDSEEVKKEWKSLING
ncbi:ATP-grasp domain protein [Carnobacterium maltaromaticum LMA28]|uniref:ATP-grasp domain protein n=1 Tax=Carnobacterium maltaromaticum LMA28 TaxID=1234679 RepID=K8E7U8_CARML|nr:ATP-grasp domain-containing protein [Carnobacterium maltaromaticum]CCO13050.2 ATP-grasp domain protein [Carnobacterium maltaromaticum LMA28]